MGGRGQGAPERSGPPAIMASMIVPSTAPRDLSVPLRERFGPAALSAGIAAVLLSFTACGYRLTGHAGGLPGVQTIGIPTFVNRTSRPQLEQRITEHVIRSEE